MCTLSNINTSTNIIANTKSRKLTRNLSWESSPSQTQSD